MRVCFQLLGVLLLSGCAAFSDLTTPSLVVSNDPFDNAVVVVQAPVSAARSLSEQANLLGFHWKSLAPNFVVFTVSVTGNVAITDLQFNADGQRIQKLVPLGKRTAHDRSDTVRTAEQRIVHARNADLSWSTKTSTRLGTPVRSRRSFVATYADFAKIARSQTVIMRVFTSDNYATSSFGRDSGAVIDTKFAPFLEQLATLRKDS